MLAAEWNFWVLLWLYRTNIEDERVSLNDFFALSHHHSNSAGLGSFVLSEKIGLLIVMRDMNLVTHILCLTISQKSDRKSFFFPTWNHLFPKKRHKSQGGANYWEKIGWRLQVFFQVSRDTALAQLMNSFWASPFKFFIGFLGRRVSSLFCFSIHYWRKNPFRFA